MSTPVSLKMAPFTGNVVAKKKYLILYLILMWMSFIPLIIEFWLYWSLFFPQNIPITNIYNLYEPPTDALLFYLLLPAEIYILYLTLVFSSMIFAKIMLIFVNLFHKPREGIFKRDPKDKDYAYWSLRSIIKKWPAWISHSFPLPWHDIIFLKFFGVKTNFSNATLDSWVNSEFVEIGKNVTIGQGAFIGSSMIMGDYLIIKKIILEDNVLIGTHTVLCPGTIMRRNSVLSAMSFTYVDQELEEGWIYLGNPAKKYRENDFFKDDIEILFETQLGDLKKWGKAMEKREHITDKGEDVEKNY